MLEDLGLDDVTFIDANRLLDIEQEQKSDTKLALQQLMDASSVASLKTVLVDHRARCFGLVLVGIDGWKLVYVCHAPNSVHKLTPLIAFRAILDLAQH